MRSPTSVYTHTGKRVLPLCTSFEEAPDLAHERVGELPHWVGMSDGFT